MATDLRLGDWRTALAGVTVDVVICDPPYSARVHAVETSRSDGYALDTATPTYDAWTAGNVYEFVESWSPRCAGWMVALTDYELAPTWQRAYEAVGRYAFAPVPCVMRGMSVRLQGDGPSSWSVYAMVARRRHRDAIHWGTLDGAYTGPYGREAASGRGKPDWLMRAIVRDYSRPGDLVCDPLAGWGATLSAAIGLGRRAIGAEIDRAAYDEARRRLGRGTQMEMIA